jgi:ketosteroid isomerase-like protein
MQASQELREAYVTLMQAFDQGETDSLLGVLSREQGALVIGTAPEEWWDTPEAAAGGYQMTVDLARSGNWRVRPGDVEAFEEGSVGWVADQPVIAMPDGQEQSMRSTAVFHREDGGWKAVQWHFSVGLPNEEVLPFQSTD